MLAEGESSAAAGRAPDIRWEESDASDYVFCSTAQPSFAFTPEGDGLVVHFLDLYNLAGYQMGSANLYMRLCHGIAEFVGEEAVLNRLGYRPGTRDEQVEGASIDTMTQIANP